MLIDVFESAVLKDGVADFAERALSVALALTHASAGAFLALRQGSLVSLASTLDPERARRIEPYAAAAAGLPLRATTSQGIEPSLFVAARVQGVVGVLYLEAAALTADHAAGGARLAHIVAQHIASWRDAS